MNHQEYVHYTQKEIYFFLLWMGNQAPVLPSQGLGCKNWCIKPCEARRRSLLAMSGSWVFPDMLRNFCFFDLIRKSQRPSSKRALVRFFFTRGWFTQKFKTTPWTSAPWVDSFQRRTPPKFCATLAASSSGAPPKKNPLINACNTWCTFHIAPTKWGWATTKIPSQVYLASIRTDDLVNYLTGYLMRLN